MDRSSHLSRGELAQGGALQIRYRALSLRWAGQFLRLGDEVFARKPKTRRRAMCKLSYVHEQNSPSHTAATGQQSCPPHSGPSSTCTTPPPHTSSGITKRRVCVLHSAPHSARESRRPEPGLLGKLAWLRRTLLCTCCAQSLAVVPSHRVKEPWACGVCPRAVKAPA